MLKWSAWMRCPGYNLLFQRSLDAAASKTTALEQKKRKLRVTRMIFSDRKKIRTGHE